MGFVSAIIKGATKEAAKSAKKSTKAATKAKGLATKQEDYSSSASLPKKESDANFTEAFKDTTIIDKEGKPEVVYHGRVQDYDSFDTSGDMSTGKELGTHFGTKEQTDVFASKEGGNVVPVYLNLKNPYHMVDSGSFNGEDIIEQLVEDGLVDSSYIDDLDLPIQELNILAKKLLKEKGFDGISYINTREGLSIKGKPITSQKKIDELQDYDLKTLIEKYGAKKSYIILEPEQAKSVFNKGSWDSKDKRFNYAKGGNVKQMEKLFAEGGMMDNSGEQVNGVEVPPGSLREEVADDIPAQLSEGEFVVPADVVRFIGLEKLMAMRDKAKQGLERMEEMGQMGNAEEVENPDQSFMQDDEDFSAEIDDIMAEEGDPTGFRIGGYVTGQDISRVPSNPAVDVGYYKHADGRMLWITKINGKPMSPPPDGFNEVSAEEFQSVGKKAEETKEAAARSAGASTSNSGGGGGGDSAGDSAGGDSGSTGIGTGPVGLGATGLNLMALGETLGKTPSVYGQLAGAVARGVGGKMADIAIDQTTDGFNAMQAASDMPGMGSRVDAQGRVTTFSSPETIAASDAAMFGTPAPGTGPNAFSPGGGFSTGPGTSTGSGVTVSPVSGEVNSGTSFAPATSSGSFAGGPNAFSPGGGFSTGPGRTSGSTSASGGGSRSISGGGDSGGNANSSNAGDGGYGSGEVGYDAGDMGHGDSAGDSAGGGGGGGGGGGDGGTHICTASYNVALITPSHFRSLNGYGARLRKEDPYLMRAYDSFGPVLASRVGKSKLMTGVAKFMTSYWKDTYKNNTLSTKQVVHLKLSTYVLRPVARMLGWVLIKFIDKK
jgi:hypothetical protein